MLASKANNLSLEKRHLQVKSRLESLLHLNLPFSIESTQLVETLFDNLIKASELYETMKNQNQEILTKLKESESQLELMKGVNTRLVEDINELNYAMMRVKEDTELIQSAQKNKIKQLEQAVIDFKRVIEEKQKRQLETEEKNSELKLKLDSFLFPNNVLKVEKSGKMAMNKLIQNANPEDITNPLNEKLLKQVRNQINELLNKRRIFKKNRKLKINAMESCCDILCVFCNVKKVEQKDCQDEVMRIYDARIEQLQNELQVFMENKQLLLEKIKQMSIQIQNREKEVIRMQDLMKKTSGKSVDKMQDDHKESLYAEKLLSSERKIDFLNNENQKLEVELQKLKGYKLYELCQMVEEYKIILEKKDGVIEGLEMQLSVKQAEVNRLLKSEDEMIKQIDGMNKSAIHPGSELSNDGLNQMDQDCGLRIQDLKNSHDEEITQLEFKIKQLENEIILEKEQSKKQSSDCNYQMQIDVLNEQAKVKEQERLALEENLKDLQHKVEELQVKIKESQINGNILQGKLTQQIRRNQLLEAEKGQEVSVVQELKKQIQEEKEQVEKQKQTKESQECCCLVESQGAAVGREVHKNQQDQVILYGQLKEFQDLVEAQQSVILKISAELEQFKKSNQKFKSQHEQLSKEKDQLTKGISDLEDIIKVRDKTIKEQEKILNESQNKLAATKKEILELQSVHQEEKENSSQKVINLEDQYAGKEYKLQGEFKIMQQKYDDIAQTLKNDKDSLEQKISQLVKENKQLEREMQKIQKDKINLEEQLQRYQMEQYLEIESKQQEIDDLIQQIKNSNSEEYSKDVDNSNKIYQLERQLRSALENVTKHKNEIERLNEELIRLQGQLMRREGEYEEKENNYAKQKKELGHALDKIKELEEAAKMENDRFNRNQVENQKRNKDIINENQQYELNRVNQVNSQLNIELKEMKEKTLELNSQIKQLKNQLVEAREQTNELNQQLMQAMKQASQARDQLQNKEAEFNATLYQKNLILETEKQNILHLQQELDHLTMNLTTRISELTNELNETKNKFQYYQVTSETAQTELAKEKKENNKKATSLSELITERDQLRKQVKKYQQDINIKTDQQLDLQSEIKVLQKQCEEFRKENNSQETECERLTSQCQILRRQVLEKDSNISILTQKLQSK